MPERSKMNRACSECGRLYPVDNPMWSTEADVEFGNDDDYTCNGCYDASAKRIKSFVEETILVARIIRIALGIGVRK
jgi:hypothetical protein